MNWEVFGWLVASFIVLELIFIFMLKLEVHENWGESKLYAFLITGLIMLVQLAIIYGFEGPMKYINLLWEFLIVAGVVLFILLNYFIASRIGNGDEK